MEPWSTGFRLSATSRSRTATGWESERPSIGWEWSRIVYEVPSRECAAYRRPAGAAGLVCLLRSFEPEFSEPCGTAGARIRRHGRPEQWTAGQLGRGPRLPD